MTVEAIEGDGFDIAARVEIPMPSDSPEDVSIAMGNATCGFTRVYSQLRPDILLVLGDRFEMHAATVAAVPMRLPVGHIHGGELTFGAIDDMLRHSITKLSHLHFTATQAYADRVIRMGEEPWRVSVSGAPSLDNLSDIRAMSQDELHDKLGVELSLPSLLVTYHPVTLEHENTEEQMGNLLAALTEVDASIVFTSPNTDTGGSLIRGMIEAFTEQHCRAKLVANLGTDAYFSMMNCVSAMVGNSSSGIIEAASFALPVVNIGNRQEGRTRGRNVIDVGYGQAEILQGIRRAISAEFHDGLDGMMNPYGGGGAAERIVSCLRAIEIDDRLLWKRFHDV